VRDESGRYKAAMTLTGPIGNVTVSVRVSERSSHSNNASLADDDLDVLDNETRLPSNDPLAGLACGKRALTLLPGAVANIRIRDADGAAVKLMF